MIGSDKNLWMNVVIPRAILAHAFPRIDDRLGLKIDGQNEALGLLRRYCRFLETGEPLIVPELITHATETIVDLIGLATGAKGEAAELAGLRGLRAASCKLFWRRSRTILPTLKSRRSAWRENSACRPAMSMISFRKRVSVSPSACSNCACTEHTRRSRSEATTACGSAKLPWQADSATSHTSIAAFVGASAIRQPAPGRRSRCPQRLMPVVPNHHSARKRHGTSLQSNSGASLPKTAPG